MEPDPDILTRLRSYLLHMAPYQKERVSGRLLLRAANEIDRLQTEQTKQTKLKQ